MRYVLRIPKDRVRIVGAASVVVALIAGAAVAAPTPGPGAANQGEALPAPPVPVETQQVPDSDQDPEGVPEDAEGGQTAQGEPQQGEPAQQQQAPPRPATGQQDTLTPQEREALALVEQMIREQEGVLMGTAFDYDPAGRRDPFRSLLVGITVDLPEGARPRGLPGFLISEVELKAIAAAQGRWHAMVVGPDQRAYFLEVGTQLFDGHVKDIRSGEVLFEQQVPDLTGARRAREVPKRLRTTESGGGQTP